MPEYTVYAAKTRESCEKQGYDYSDGTYPSKKEAIKRLKYLMSADFAARAEMEEPFRFGWIEDSDCEIVWDDER